MGIQWSVQAAPPPLHPATTATSYERVDHGVLQASQGLSKALAGASSSEEALAQEASHELQQVIQRDRSLAAQCSAVASALALANRQVVSTERAINQIIVQIDQLTQAPETNLLPITPGSSVGHLGSVNLPALPAAPPVHTTTGASGVL